MKKASSYILGFLMFALLACDDIVKDETIPMIDMSQKNAFPQNCATVYRGESFTFNARFTDNIELGSYSIQLHHNFDHHTHSTSSVICEMGAIKSAVKPLLLIEEYTIPAGLKEYFASLDIFIPKDVDTGDYHFTVRLTDKSGWQSFEGISIKVAER